MELNFQFSYVLSGWGFQQAKDFCGNRDAVLP